MKQILKPHNFYTLLWCLYYLQDTLYAGGSIVSRLILVLFMLPSFYYFFVVNTSFETPPIIKAFNVLVVLFGLYGAIRLFVDTSSWLSISDATTFLKEYELSILPVYAFYYFGRKGYIDDNWFFKTTIIFVVVAVLSFRREYLVRMAVATSDAATINTGYMVLSLFPITLFLNKRPVYQYSIVLLLLGFVMYGMKRGAILIGLLVFLILFFYQFKDNKSIKRKITVLILSLFMVVAATVFVQRIILTSQYFAFRMERTLEGDSSGRDELYSTFYNHFIHEPDALKLLFGNGADGSLKVMGEYAHNDWLQIALDLGLNGIVVYLFFWFVFIRTWLRSRKVLKSDYSLAIGLLLLITLSRSFFSMSINGMTLFGTSVLGYCLSLFSNSEKKSKTIRHA